MSWDDVESSPKKARGAGFWLLVFVGVSAVALTIKFIATGTVDDVAEGSRVSEGVEIPRSSAGDKGSYYLLENSRTGAIARTLHKRVGVEAVGWSRSEIDCSTMRIRDLGYSEVSAAEAGTSPTTGWTELVPGSSKSDLVHFVCSR